MAVSVPAVHNLYVDLRLSVASDGADRSWREPTRGGAP